MAKQTVNIGTVADDATGDTGRASFDKLNDNDDELYDGAHVVAATSKTTPVDADVIGIQDSAASNSLAKVSWARIKAVLKTYFDTLYALGDMTVAVYDPATIAEQVVGLVATQTLTNKSIDSANNTITNIVDADVSATAAILATKVRIPQVGTPTFETLHDAILTQTSSGIIQGGAITDGGAGTIDVALGSCWLRSSASNIVQNYLADFSAQTGMALTDGVVNYIYVNYGAGTPVVQVDTAFRDLNNNPVLGMVIRDGTTVHITNASVPTQQISALLGQRQAFVDGITRESGSITTETGNRLLAMTSGTHWLSLNQITIAAIDTSVADTWTSYYDDNAGGFTAVAAQTVIDNLQYDDGSGTLATLAAAKYGVHWVYRGLDANTYVVYGTGSYSLADAIAATPPTNTPVQIVNFHAVLVAKITVQKSATNLTAIENPWTTTFAGGVATDHGDLGGLTDDDHTQYLLADATRDADGVQMLERADHPNTPGATKGQLWVRSDTPNVLVFTDDAGTDTDLGVGASLQQYKTIYIPAGAITPNTTTGATAGTQETATYKHEHDYFAFLGITENQRISFDWAMPDDWDLGTIKAKFYASPASGASLSDVYTFELKALAIGHDDTLDAAYGTGQNVDTTVTVNTNSDLLVSAATPAITVAGTPTLGDLVLFKITRLQDDVADTMAEDANLRGIAIQYRTLTTAIAAW